MDADAVMVGWTTTATREEAERLAAGLVEARLAACAQVSGPLTSVYRWQGAVESATEFRVTVKFAARRREALTAWLAQNHRYELPQWVFCPAAGGLEKYLKWVVDDST